jgi:WD40 repeat protein
MKGSVGGLHLRLRGRIELADYPLDAAWAADGGSLAIAGGEGAVLLADTGPVLAARQIGRHRGGALAVAWQRAGRLFASSGQDGAVLLWDARTLVPRGIHQGAAWCDRLAFADHGRLLAVASGRALYLFDAAGALLHSLAGHVGVIAALAWRPKSSEIAAAGNGGARLHRLEPSVSSRDYPAAGACLTAGWNADGRLLAAGMQDGSVQIWNVATGLRSQLTAHGSKIIAAEWSANGRYLATAAGEELIAWDFNARGPQTAEPLPLRAHSERLSALAFRPGGSMLASAARDRRLLLWRLGGDSQPLDAHLLREECTFLHFSRDGGQLAVGDAAGGLSLFAFG